MPPVCAYYLCKNMWKNKIPMFKFPTGNPKRLEVWLNNCGNKTITHLPLRMLRHKLICIEHFDKKYIRNVNGKRIQLNKLAVPVSYKGDESNEPHSPDAQELPEIHTIPQRRVYQGPRCLKNKEKKKKLEACSLRDMETMKSKECSNLQISLKSNYSQSIPQSPISDQHTNLQTTPRRCGSNSDLPLDIIESEPSSDSPTTPENHFSQSNLTMDISNSEQSTDIQTNQKKHSSETDLTIDVPNSEQSTALKKSPKSRRRRGDLDSPMIKKLKLAMINSNTVIKRLRHLNNRLNKKNSNKQLLDLNKVKFNSEWSKLITMMQLRKKQNQWSEAEKKFCLSLYHKSPAVYKYMRKNGIVLPGRSTIGRWLQSTNDL